MNCFARHFPFLKTVATKRTHTNSSGRTASHTQPYQENKFKNYSQHNYACTFRRVCVIWCACEHTTDPATKLECCVLWHIGYAINHPLPPLRQLGGGTTQLSPAVWRCGAGDYECLLQRIARTHSPNPRMLANTTRAECASGTHTHTPGRRHCQHRRQHTQ